MRILRAPLAEITAADIEQLCSDGITESLEIEFKRELPARDRKTPDGWHRGNRFGEYARNAIAEEIVAFANTQGGAVVLGIDESDDHPKRAQAIVPVPRAHELARRLRQAVHDVIDPPLPMLEAVAVEIPNTGGSGVVVLRVPASRRTHRLQSKDKSAAPDPTNTPNPPKDKSATPNPTKDKSATPDPIKDKSATPDPIKGKARWMSGGIIFSLTALAIIVGWSLGSAPPVPPVPQKEENLADKYANMTEQQLINSLPENYKSELVYLEQGNRWSAAVSIKTRAEAEAVASNQLAQHGVNFSGQGQRTDPKILVIIDAIIKLEEHTRPYISGQGNTYFANKQYDLAIQKFDEAISLGDTKLYYNRGLAWLAKHEYERAIADFTQAAKFEHGNHFIYLHRAEANEQKGERDSAIDDYLRALAIAPDLTVADQIKAALKRLAAARN